MKHYIPNQHKSSSANYVNSGFQSNNYSLYRALKDSDKCIVIGDRSKLCITIYEPCGNQIKETKIQASDSDTFEQTYALLANA